MRHSMVFGLVVSVGVAGLLRPADPAPISAPELVRIADGPPDHRPASEFRQGNRVVDAPRSRVNARPLEIMKHHVSEAEYAACVADKACPAATYTGRPEFAQTNINHADATAYAVWLSGRKGQRWRLPTDAEWLRAAGERGADDGFAAEANGADPSRRRIASYQREVALRGEADLIAHPLGISG